MDPMSALPIPATLKSGAMAAASINMSALITKVNKPNVRMLTGNVSSKRIGSTNTLTSPMMITANSAAVKSFTSMPGVIFATMYKASAFKNHLTMIDTIHFYHTPQKIILQEAKTTETTFLYIVFTCYYLQIWL